MICYLIVPEMRLLQSGNLLGWFFSFVSGTQLVLNVFSHSSLTWFSPTAVRFWQGGWRWDHGIIVLAFGVGIVSKKNEIAPRHLPNLYYIQMTGSSYPFYYGIWSNAYGVYDS